MDKVRNVLVVGAGITGLTLATALRQRGIEVDVAEVKKDVREQPGVGLSMQGNSLAAMGRIGLAAAILRHSVPGSYLDIRRPDGVLLAHMPLVPMGGPGYPGTAGISRSRLHAILLDAATEAGARIRLGTSFDTIADQGDGVDVAFTDGSRGRYDLVVGADGLYSKVRALLFPGVGPRYLGQSVWRAGVPRMPGNFTTDMHFGGEFGIVGVCPVSESQAYLYVIETADPAVRHEEADGARVLRDKLVAYTSPVVRHAVSHLASSTSISYRPLEALLVADRWYKGRVMIAGDAAHCGPPVIAQGAAMGIEDAVALAETLATAGPIEERLAAFMQRRLPRASRVVNTSVQLCEWEVNHQASPQEVGRVMREAQVALCEPF